MSDKELYEKWSCGQGALVVLDQKDVDVFIKFASQNFHIEARVVGEIYDNNEPSLRIKSKFSGQTIEYK
jgi:phosphoribosylaminoimidazole (AIR) synthetase